MERLMSWMYVKTKTFTEKKHFDLAVGLIIFLNPLAILPQVITAVFTPSVQGISLSMWFMFCLIQTGFMLDSIKKKNPVIFFCMLMCFIETIALIVSVMLKR